MELDRRLRLISRISHSNERKILLIVIDGLGGLGHDQFDGKTELQYADLPNLDSFVQHRRTVTGLIYPVARGIVPGSGPGHLGLFGYDPEYYQVGRGALEAADVAPGEVEPGDVTARFNFCRVDRDRIVQDRRAHRLSDGSQLADLLNKRMSRVDGAVVKVIASKSHRGVFVIKNGGGISPYITDTDPGEVGRKILQARAAEKYIGGQVSKIAPAERTAQIVNAYTKEALEILKDRQEANAIIFRGFSTFRHLPVFNIVYSVNAAAISAYPLYRGLARILGMSVLGKPKSFDEEIRLLDAKYNVYDFFYLHYKDPDERGEDGDFLGKVGALQRFDSLFPQIVSKNSEEFKKGVFRFEVIAVTGDHSTPAVIGAHTHHSVPLAIYSDFMKGFDKTQHFDEEECTRGTRGRIMGPELMTILLANARKLSKFEGFEKDYE